MSLSLRAGQLRVERRKQISLAQSLLQYSKRLSDVGDIELAGALCEHSSHVRPHRMTACAPKRYQPLHHS